MTEQTDDEIADEELGGDELLLLMPGSWRELWQTPDRVCGLLEAAELGGFTAASALLDSWAWPDNRAELRRSGRRPPGSARLDAECATGVHPGCRGLEPPPAACRAAVLVRPDQYGHAGKEHEHEHHDRNHRLLAGQCVGLCSGVPDGRRGGARTGGGGLKHRGCHAGARTIGKRATRLVARSGIPICVDADRVAVRSHRGHGGRLKLGARCG
ncbi:MAG TPA: hypothetical protein VHH52_12160 [Pseudonocardiaceae bacterium]|nr:hypothetical protein [Pseudonocardiaceae bacterium]